MTENQGFSRGNRITRKELRQSDRVCKVKKKKNVYKMAYIGALMYRTNPDRRNLQENERIGKFQLTVSRKLVRLSVSCSQDDFVKFGNLDTLDLNLNVLSIVFKTPPQFGAEGLSN